MVSRLLTALVCSAALVALTGCKSGTTCKSYGSGYGQSSRVTWGECSDNSKREVTCELFSPGKYECKCIKDGAEGKGFDHTSGNLGDKEKSTEIANESCGWDLKP